MKELCDRFVYQSDRKDRWTILGDGNWHGDCEDFALTALWLLSGKSWLRLWWLVLTCQAVIWHASTAGGPHVMLWVRGKGWIDNWYPVWSSYARHQRVFPYLAPILAIKLLQR